MQALTINAQECAFTMPIANRDWRRIHKDVYATINGRDTPDDRHWVFSVTPLSPDKRIAIVTARAPALGDHLDKTDQSLSVRVGDTLRIECPLSCSQRQKNAEGRDVEKWIPATNVPDYGAAVIERFGMSAESVRFHSYQRRWIPKPSGEFFVMQANILADVTITDPEKFAQGYLYGVGRKKTYGLGMMEVIDHDVN